MASEKFLIVLSGPTAIGKTDLSIEIAKRYACPILSADSRQFYKEMHIGTAKPDLAEMQGVPHYFIDNKTVLENYTVGDYEKEVLAKLDEIYKNQDVAILAGGSGLYIQAVCEGLDTFPEVPEAIRIKVRTQFETQGLAYLQAQLKEHDPVYFEEVDQQNPVRLMRALEVCISSGKPFSSFRNKNKKKRDFTILYICLKRDRENLYERINTRVDQMLEAGLIEEVKALLPHQQLNALQTVGYKELFDFLDGNCSLETAVELIKRNTRRYAKRQMTWFRNKPEWAFFHPEDKENIFKHLDKNNI